MKNKINVLSLQFTPIKADKLANIEKAKKLIIENGQNKYDLIVFPEFFDTGINLSNKEIFDYAEIENSSIVLQELSKLAKQYDSYVHCGSICFKENSKIYNRAYFLDRNGDIIAKYDKIHLFNYLGGNEGTYTTAGDKLCIVETDFGKIGLTTCFDTRFPEMFTKLTKMGAELFVIPAAWLMLKNSSKKQKDLYVNNWQLMLKARAYDNLAFVVSANEFGDVHPMLDGIGYSMIIDYEGCVLSQADDRECAIYQEIDFSLLRKARAKFPIDKIN